MKCFRFSKTTLTFLLFTISALILPIFFNFVGITTSRASDLLFGEENIEEKCRLLAENGCQNMISSECRQALESCESYYQKESDKIEADLSKTSQEKNTLQNTVSTLNQKIKNLSYQISQSNLVIKDLGVQIEDTTDSIGKTSMKIDDLKERLSEILRTVSEEDKKPLIEVLFFEDDLSNFFDNLVALEVLNSKNKELLQEIKTLKTNLEEQKSSLDEEKGGLEKMVQIQTLQKEESSKTKKDKEYYLNITEQEYQKQLKQKTEVAKKAAGIRARIFELLGVSKAPTFGEAYEIAKYVSSITGVRPAFLLAVLTQESNIGKNVGQCYITDFTTGAGTDLKGNPKTRVMNPKYINQFVALTTSLGMEPTKTPVSCWMPLYSNGAPYGWGGAMGPAQFIASTWNLYKDKVSQITSKTANPWDIKDAFLAAGLLLKDNGALNNEFTAAMKYFSGSSWTKAEEFYGRSVLAIADGYVKDIAAIEAK